MARRREVLRGLAAAGLGVLAARARAATAEPLHDARFAQDFDELWRTLAERYCFFDAKSVDWRLVRATYRPLALAARSQEEFARVLAATLAELYDAHTHLAEAPDGTPRYPPYDLLVAPDGDAARVQAVLEGSAAAAAGITYGVRITHVDGRPVAQLARELAPRCLARPDPAATRHAWNTAVAGRRGEPRRITVEGHRGGGGAAELQLPLAQRPGEESLSWQRLAGGVGYVRIASFADAATVDAFDTALLALRDAPGLVLDVRANGGGDTAVARPIMGRFIQQEQPYARMRRREGRGLGPAWTETVAPRGPFTYGGPVVVLCDHWSASMAEGFPMGMRAIVGARIVGTPMMGLGAAVFRLRLDHGGIEAQYSAEPVYDVQDRPRWLLQPDVLVEPGSDALAAGIAELGRRLVTRR